ncbi:hypothetical protein ABKN59_006571 [Abortiporus biennis]
MSYRKRVKEAFHAELTDYSYLLRALRTDATLDLTSNLLPGVSCPYSYGNEEEKFEDDLEEIEPADDPESQQGTQATLVASQTSTTRPKAVDFVLPPSENPNNALVEDEEPEQSSRNTWSRWPLLFGDVHLPEWQLDEEIRLIALRSIQATHRRIPVKGDSDSEDFSSDGDEEEQEEDVYQRLLSPEVLEVITSQTSHFLSRIFASLADLNRRVPVESLGNRVKPFDWATVLNTAEKTGLVDRDKLHTIKHRLVDMYQTGNPPETSTSKPHAPSQSSILSGALAQISALEDDSIFTLDVHAAIPDDSFKPPIDSTDDDEYLPRRSRAKGKGKGRKKTR